ncbi:MAG: UDP-N-acetylglucosamine 1-carboxyvinyltransferase [Ignavibacteria bacterium]|nr:UDP-N-acetylglucosamine 1-carboxyvinyltransferase [Ignavibacteria bacterium]
MDKFVIEGGKPLSGTVQVSGAKNASLPLLSASLLSGGIFKLYNTPRLNDVITMLKLLEHLGVEYSFSGSTVELNTAGITHTDAPYEWVKKMRASIYVLGPLLSRFGQAKVSLPGGCAWGPRPVDLHISGLKKMGAEISIENGYIIATCKRLHGTKINFDHSSVGATGNLMMAAALAQGTTILNNAAMEPEITNLARFLTLMGARINGIGTPILEIEGVDALQPAEIHTIPDRIEAGTLLIAAAMTRSTITISGCNDIHLYSVLAKLQDAGAKLNYTDDTITIDAQELELKTVDISTGPFPGFPTDMQAQWIALMTLAGGVSTITDTIYLDRFSHVPELNRLGANIIVHDNSATVRGVSKLTGAKVMSTDLRASASLVLAGLAAEGITEVLRVYHLDRGYEKLESKLASLGAGITRVSGSEY